MKLLRGSPLLPVGSNMKAVLASRLPMDDLDNWLILDNGDVARKIDRSP